MVAKIVNLDAVVHQRGATSPGRGAAQAPARGRTRRRARVAVGARARVRARRAAPPAAHAPRRLRHGHRAARHLRVLPPRPALQQVAPRLSLRPLPAVGPPSYAYASVRGSAFV